MNAISSHDIPTQTFITFIALCHVPNLNHLSQSTWPSFLAVGLYVDKLSVVYLFQWQQMSIHSGLGWLSILASLANSVAGAMFLMWIVSSEG